MGDDSFAQSFPQTGQFLSEKAGKFSTTEGRWKMGNLQADSQAAYHFVGSISNVGGPSPLFSKTFEMGVNVSFLPQFLL